MTEDKELKVADDDIYGIIHDLYGLTEENSLYTVKQLKEIDPAFEPQDRYDGAFWGNDTYLAFRLTGDTPEQTEQNIRNFLTGKYNEDGDIGTKGWHWYTVDTNLFTDERNETTIEYINKFGLTEQELRMREEDEYESPEEEDGIFFNETAQGSPIHGIVQSEAGEEYVAIINNYRHQESDDEGLFPIGYIIAEDYNIATGQYSVAEYGFETYEEARDYYETHNGIDIGESRLPELSEEERRQAVKQNIKKEYAAIKKDKGNSLKYTEKTAQGFAVLGIVSDQEGYNVALIKRPNDFVVAGNYHEEDGTWGQGHYDFSTPEEALQYIEKNYKPKEKLQIKNYKIGETDMNENMNKSDAGWRKFYLPQNAIIAKSETEKGAAFIMPDSTIYKGYTMFVPKKGYELETNKKTGSQYYSILCKENSDFKFQLRNRLGDVREITSEELLKLQEERRAAKEHKQVHEEKSKSGAQIDKLKTQKSAAGRKQKSEVAAEMYALEEPMRIFQSTEKAYRLQDSKGETIWVPKNMCTVEKTAEGAEMVVSMKADIAQKKNIPLKNKSAAQMK